MAEQTPPTLNPALRDFWQTPARNKVLYGGRASSKSWDAAGFAIYLANAFKVRFLCARQIQNKIDQSVYTLLKTQISRFGLGDNFEILKNKIICKTTGSEFVFYGLWRHIDEIKSLEGVDICWIEEAHGLTQYQWDVLEPTIRKDGSEFWIIFNPQLASDFVYQKFVVNMPPDTIVRHINYNENPFLSDTLLKIIDEKKQSDFDEYVHIYLGQPKTDDNLSLIKRSWLNAAIDADKKLGLNLEDGAAVVGFDVADCGADKNALAIRQGGVLVDLMEWQGGQDDLLNSFDKAHRVAESYNAQIIYDPIGVGAGAGARFLELNQKAVHKIAYHKFNAGAMVASPNDKEKGAQVTNADRFANLKAQAWRHIAERLLNTYNAIHHGATFEPSELIAIDGELPHLNALLDELAAPRGEIDANGRERVESKDKLARRGIKSPNLADAFVMAFSAHWVQTGARVRAVAGERVF